MEISFLIKNYAMCNVGVRRKMRDERCGLVLFLSNFMEGQTLTSVCETAK